MPYPAFDRSRLKIQPLAARTHDLPTSARRPPPAAPGSTSEARLCNPASGPR
jgi:hypothetical protein